jgi:dual-specificity kinase
MEPICGKIGIKMIKAAAKATQQKLFKDFKLDYPNAETTKQSRKYVRAMRQLRVLSQHSIFVSYSGNDPSGYGVE